MDKFKIILVDPPWKYSDKSLNRGGAERYYETMTLQQLKSLPVMRLADDGECVLCMWTTKPQMVNALVLMQSWGFEYVTGLFDWVKTYPDNNPNKPFIGMGHYTRSNTEYMIMGRKPKGRTPKRLAKNISCVQYAPVTSHSEKPAKFRDLLVDLFGDVPRVELFARDVADGWEVWGDAVESTVKLNQYPSLVESIHSASKEARIGYNDHRAICPDCYGHGQLEGHDDDKAIGFVFVCKYCGFMETGFNANQMKSSMRDSLRRMERGE